MMTVTMALDDWKREEGGLFLGEKEITAKLNMSGFVAVCINEPVKYVIVWMSWLRLTKTVYLVKSYIILPFHM